MNHGEFSLPDLKIIKPVFFSDKMNAHLEVKASIHIDRNNENRNN